MSRDRWPGILAAVNQSPQTNAREVKPARHSRLRFLISPPVGVVGLVGLVIGALFAVSLLRFFDWNPAVFLRVGALDPIRVQYVEDRLGDIPLVPELGHDGKYFFIQANDPLLLSPGENAVFLDRATYRAQRMFYPLLASFGSPWGPRGVAWGLVFVNVLAFGFGTWATARLARSMGGSTWLGMAFALNPGLIFEAQIDGAGVLAWALAVAALSLLETGNESWASLAVTLAVLARETMILVALGAGLFLWRSQRRMSIGLLAVPVVAAACWALWVRARLGVPILTAESEELGVPGVGLWTACGEWLQNPDANLVAGVLSVLVLFAVAYQLVARPSYLSWGTAGYCFLALLLTQQVWNKYFDISRALAPIFTAFLVAVLTPWKTPAEMPE